MKPIKGLIGPFDLAEIAVAAETRVEELEETWAELHSFWADTEARSADAHAVYQAEAHRRGDVRHDDDYAKLSEATKEWDRVLVRWIQRECSRIAALSDSDSGDLFCGDCGEKMPLHADGCCRVADDSDEGK